MFTRKAAECTIQYVRDSIVLSGANESIRTEAQRILRRFAHSSRRYEVRIDRPGRIVLTTAH